MRRLLEDAERLAGVEFDISSYADIVQAIHVIQQEMGITGTTAAEASATITGSMSALKASLENLFVAISSGDRIQESFKNLFDTAVAFGQNYFPRIEQSIEGIIQLVPEAIPLIFDKVPEILDKEVPKVTESAVKILNKIIETLSDKESIDKLTSTAVGIVKTLANGLAEITPDLLSGTAAIITNLINILFDPTNLNELIKSGAKILKSIVEGIPTAFSELYTGVSNVISKIIAFFKAPENVQDLKNGAAQIISDVKDGIIEFAGNIGKGAGELLDKFIEFMTDEDAWRKIGETAGKIVTELGDAIIKVLDLLGEAADKMFEKFGEYLKDKDWEQIGDDIMKALAEGAKAFWAEIQPKLDELNQAITDWFENIDWHKVGYDIMSSIIDGVLDTKRKNEELKERLTSFWKSIIEPNWDAIGEWLEERLLDSLTLGGYSVGKGIYKFLTDSGTEEGRNGFARGIKDAWDDGMKKIEDEIGARTHREEEGTAGYLDRVSKEGLDGGMTVNIYAREMSASELRDELIWARKAGAMSD